MSISSQNTDIKLHASPIAFRCKQKHTVATETAKCVKRARVNGSGMGSDVSIYVTYCSIRFKSNHTFIVTESLLSTGRCSGRVFEN
jgi:hypothetical protein